MDFNEVNDRRNTYNSKWDDAKNIYHNDDVIPMWIADMDFKSPPAVVEAIQKQANTGIYGYAIEPETTRLPQAIANWLQTKNGWTVDPTKLGYSTGVIGGLSAAIRALTKEGDTIITQAPFYGHFKSAIEDSKRKLISNLLVNNDGHYEFDWDNFEQQIQTEKVKMAILCNPHNPTGRVWQPDELKRFVEICQKYQVIILSDDIHSDLILDNNNYQPLAKLCPEYQNQIITFKSTAKTFNLAGLQFAYYYTENDDYRQKMAAAAQYSANPDLPNAFVLPATLAAYEQSDEWLEELLVYLQANFQWLTTQLTTRTNAKVTPSEATYLAWIDVSYLNISERRLKTALAHGGVGVQTNQEFGLNPDQGLFIRLNFGTPRATLEEGVNRLIAVLQDLA